jgi:hypothetical protein
VLSLGTGVDCIFPGWTETAAMTYPVWEVLLCGLVFWPETAHSFLQNFSAYSVEMYFLKKELKKI